MEVKAGIWRASLHQGHCTDCAGRALLCSLTSIAEQHHSVRTTRMDDVAVKTLDELFSQLVEQGVSPEKLYETVRSYLDQRGDALYL